MADLFYFNNQDTVLLLGEGNFSFTLSLLKLYASRQKKVNVISTCFQSFRNLNESAKLNARMANKLGAEVWFGIDATQVNNHEHLGSKYFDGIVFNFPHINGKMKIDRNRLLLKEFFSSSALILKPEGKILVTLCQGQSGTPFDHKQRKEEDSWQLISMATYGGLILKDAMPFVASLWEDYACSGYRGLEKKFHVENAFTFSFVKSTMHLENSKPLHNVQSNDEPHCTYVKSKITQFSRSNCFPEVVLFQSFFETLTNSKNLHISESLLHICLCSKPLAQWWEEIELSSFTRNNLKSVLVCNSCSRGNFQDQIKRLILINSSCTETIAQRLFDKLNFIEKISPGGTTYRAVTEFIASVNGVTIGTLITEHSRVQILAIQIDAFLELKANFMSPKLVLPIEFDVPTTSLHPPFYIHDVSMWVAPEFSELDFACHVRNICGDLIRCLTKLDSYISPTDKRASFCYRLKYQSLAHSLSPLQCFFFHSKILGSLLEKHLSVRIR